MGRSSFSEDELGRKWDRCVYDGILKLGGGFTIGVISSVLFFKRKSWPLLFGSGFGFGLAYGNCERQITQFLSVKSEPKKASI